MFSVEQLLANDTFDRMMAISDSLVRCAEPPAYMFLYPRNAYGCRTGDFVSSSLCVSLQRVPEWHHDMRTAFTTLASIICGAISENVRYFNRPVPAVPHEVIKMFQREKEETALPIPLFGGGAYAYTHAYTYNGHAALCMWATGSVSFPYCTRADSFRAVRSSLQALTSIWSLAAAQNAALRGSSSEEV